MVSRARIGIVGIALVAACSGEEVHGRAVGIDRMTQPDDVRVVTAVNGVYGDGCQLHAGKSWSLPIPPATAHEYDLLTVIPRNEACVLTLTELETSRGWLDVVRPIPLSTMYATDATGLVDANPTDTAAQGQAPIQLYANARLDNASFIVDFVVTVVYSDDPDLVSGANAEGSVARSTATAESIPAPDDDLDIAGIQVATDERDVVESATGAAALTAGSVMGQTYVIVAGSPVDTSYAAIAAAYAAASPRPVAAAIPADAFALAGTTLGPDGEVRTVIVANLDAASQVASYEVFTVTFRAPVRTARGH
jgi:hypothetical protein